MLLSGGDSQGQREEGTEGGRDRGREGTEGGRDRGMKGQRDEGTEGGRDRGMKGQMEEGTEGGRDRGMSISLSIRSVSFRLNYSFKKRKHRDSCLMCVFD